MIAKDLSESALQLAESEIDISSRDFSIETFLIFFANSIGLEKFGLGIDLENFGLKKSLSNDLKKFVLENFGLQKLWTW